MATRKKKDILEEQPEPDCKSYKMESLVSVKSFNPIRTDCDGCTAFKCQVCGENTLNGYIIELSMMDDKTKENFIESFVICEECAEAMVMPLLNALARNVDELAQYESNL